MYVFRLATDTEKARNQWLNYRLSFLIFNTNVLINVKFLKKKMLYDYILSQFCLKSEISYYLQFVACYFLYKSTENPEVKALKEQLDNERKK